MKAATPLDGREAFRYALAEAETEDQRREVDLDIIRALMESNGRPLRPQSRRRLLTGLRD